ncbi:unnamed protein product, partial [Haemonchus placei]|uniref:C-type lectin domain-containing protein n=1 Tax=Haemonchus placei TaxID=6290 RepID=A0A0N4W8M4_HAEPC
CDPFISSKSLFVAVVGHCDSGWAYFDKTDSCYRVSSNILHVINISKAGVEYKKADDLTWIGLKQQNYPTSEAWTWTDGTPFDYNAWGPSQPVDKKGRDHCAQVVLFQCSHCSSSFRPI